MIPRRLRRAPRRPRHLIEVAADIPYDDMEELARQWNRILASNQRTIVVSGATVKEIHP